MAKAFIDLHPQQVTDIASDPPTQQAQAQGSKQEPSITMQPQHYTEVSQLIPAARPVSTLSTGAKLSRLKAARLGARTAAEV